MEPGSYIIQVYRCCDDGYWWRLISPNGRPLGCAIACSDTPDEARAAVAAVVAGADRLEPVLRITQKHRWLWTLLLDGVPTVRGAMTQDRHIRCVMSWQRFVFAAPLAVLGADVHIFPHRAPAGPMLSAGRS